MIMNRGIIGKPPEFIALTCECKPVSEYSQANETNETVKQPGHTSAIAASIADFEFTANCFCL
jgi:hypothetical protein